MVIRCVPVDGCGFRSSNRYATTIATRAMPLDTSPEYGQTMSSADLVAVIARSSGRVFHCITSVQHLIGIQTTTRSPAVCGERSRWHALC